MWNNKLLVLIIVVLLGFNLFMTYRFIQLNQQVTFVKEAMDVHRNYALDTYETNFITNILTDNFRLDDLSIQDTLGKRTSLKSTFQKHRKQMLVCRLSERHCESCVSTSIQTLQKWADSVGVSNLMLFGQHRNSKFLNQIVSSYGIQNIKVYNVAGINIPAEELDYPYYFLLDSNLRVSSVFVPNKAAPAITERYLSTIRKKFSTR